MSINSTSGMSSTSNLLQALNTISNPGGTGLPVTTYATEMQSALNLQLLTGPNKQLSNLQNQQTALNSLQSALQSLQSATNTLAASQNWNTVTATSSNASSYSITVNSGAQPSIYSIDILNLAQNQIDVGTQSFTGTSSVIATGTFIIEPTGGSAAPVTITIDSSNNTLQDLVNSINTGSNTTDVQAGLIYNGSGYELSLSSTKTGTNYAFSITGSAVSQFGISVTPTMNASNANMLVDNVNITSQSNSFVNAIPNVTINAVATGTGTITLNSDASTTISNVQNWMNSYNAVVDLIKTDTSYTAPGNGNNASSGPLFNDVVANTLNSSLPNTVMQSISNSTLSSLAQIGIVIDPTTGHLEFQPSNGFGVGGTVSLQDGKTTFTNALNNDAQSVETLFGVVSSGSLSSATTTNGVLGNLTNLLNSYLIGSNGQSAAITGDLTSISQQQTSINNYITLLNQQISTQVANFTKQLNQLNAAMQNSQFQASQLSALIGGSNSSSSSSSSSKIG